MGQKIGLLTALQRRRIEAAEMKLLKPLVLFCGHKGFILWSYITTKQMATYAANCGLQAY